MTRVIGPRKSRRRRWTFLCTLLVAVGFGVLFIPGAFAVHDDQFQLDGDVSHACPSPPGLCTSSQKDWADFFNVSTGATTQTVSVNNSLINAAGPFTSATFSRDFESGSSCAINSSSTTFCTGDDTTFATGSKDTLDITGWQCNHDNNVNSKIDIMNSYAVGAILPNGDRAMYFGLEKNKDNGTNDVGFWFLQGDANCPAPTTTGTHPSFTGSHQVGDVLVVSEFSNGGGVSNITAYRWVGGANPLVQIAQALGNGGDCKSALGGDTLCATTNSGTKPFNTNITTPWLTSDATLGVGNTVVPPDFFEGGIDLTLAFQQSGGGTVPSCFNTFIADTRSSTTTSSTLFDYTRSSLGQCNTTLSTQTGVANPPNTGESAPPTSIGGGSVSSGTDTSTLTVTGTSNWTGTLTWYLCGPDAALTTCDTTKGVLVTTTNNVTANGAYVSGTATLTSAGHYCWHSHFEPSAASKTAGVKAADDAGGATECFDVAPVTPTLATTALVPNGSPPPNFIPAQDPITKAITSVSFGSNVYDSATLSGAATEPGSGGPSTTYPTINPATVGSFAGTIGFTLKGPDGASTNCTTNATAFQGENQTFPITVNVTGNTTYGGDGSIHFKPGSPGTYHWIATYTDSNSPNNTSPVTHNGSCNDTAEDVIVQQIPTTISTGPSTIPQDSATITSTQAGDNIPPGGTVTFYLYNSAANCALHGTTVGQGGLLYSQGFPTNASGGNPPPANSETFNSANAVSVNSNSTVAWRVTYATGDTAHTGRQSDCVERQATTFTSDGGPGTLFP